MSMAPATSMRKPDPEQRVRDQAASADHAWASLCDELRQAQLARSRLLGALAPKLIGPRRRGTTRTLAPEDLEAMRLIQASLDDIDERMRRFIDPLAGAPCET